MSGRMLRLFTAAAATALSVSAAAADGCGNSCGLPTVIYGIQPGPVAAPPPRAPVPSYLVDQGPSYDTPDQDAYSDPYPSPYGYYPYGPYGYRPYGFYGYRPFGPHHHPHGAGNFRGPRVIMGAGMRTTQFRSFIRPGLHGPAHRGPQVRPRIHR